MGKQATLTRHAISPPAFEGGKVHRERLVDALHANIPRRLIAVIAPAGYGKTTMLADFASHTELPVCWLRLTEGDRDPMRMAGVLQASLASRFRRLRHTLRVAAMVGADEASVAMAFAQAIRGAVEEPFVLIVDDIHLVNDSASVMGFWKTFLEHQPEQVTLVMAGREVPNVAMDGLLERGQVAGLGPLELALTRDEMRELSRRTFGKDLREDDLERLQRETGGWVMGVLLSGAVPVSGLGVLVQSQRPMVYDYLAAVVLNRQPRALREFLLHSAVLPVMTAEACDEVLRRSDSGRVLLHALRGGMFLSSTGERPKTYEYHPQFREFLLATLQQEDAPELRRLRVRAGAYLARQGSIEAAVDLYLEAGDTKRAGRLAEKHARAIRRAGKMETLERWRERLKGEERAYVGLSIQVATGHADRGRPADARELFSMSVRISRRRGWNDYLAAAFTGLALIAWLRESFRVGMKHARRALHYSGLQSAPLLKADALRYYANFLMVLSPANGESLKLIDRAVALAMRHDDPYATAVFLADRARIALELGQVAGTTEVVRTFRKLMHRLREDWLRPSIIGHLAWAEAYEGRYLDALNGLDEAAQAAAAAANSRDYLFATGMRAYLLGLAGRTDDALAVLEAAAPHIQHMQSGPIAWYAPATRFIVLRWGGRTGEARLEAGRLRSAQPFGHPPPWAERELLLAEQSNNLPKLCVLLEEHISKRRVGYPRSERVRAWWLLARAHDQLGSTAKANTAFERSLQDAQSPAAINVIAEEAYHDQLSLRRLIVSGPNAERVAQIKERMASIRTFEGALRGRNSKPGEAALVEVRAFGVAIDVFLNDSKLNLRPLDRELLLVLVTERATTGDMLYELFWPGRPRGAQTASLHSAIYRLRNELGSAAIARTDEGYRIPEGTEYRYDVATFRNVISRIRKEGRVYSAELMDLAHKALEAFGTGFSLAARSEWANRIRSELEVEFVWLAEWYARMALGIGLIDEGIRAARRGLQLDPYSESLNGITLDMLARAGKVRELGEAYERYVAVLREDLGLDPPLAMRAKHADLLLAVSR